MKAKIGVGSKGVCCILESLVVMVDVNDCMPTTRSREMSGANAMDRLFFKNREVSYPPNVKLP